MTHDMFDVPMEQARETVIYPKAMLEESLERLATLEEVERLYISMVLAKVGDHKEKVARILGINRRTLYRKEREYGLIQSA